ncbi:MAG: winged helix-turn-helix domain-containing protein [Pseudomonadota bacterium]
MLRVLLILGALSIAYAAYLATRASPWAAADEKAAADIAIIAELAALPDRVSWQLSRDASLKRVVVWDSAGERTYPPPGGIVPMVYEISQDKITELAQKQQITNWSEWSWFDLAESALLYCAERPAICVVYDRALLEDILTLQTGVLTDLNRSRARPLFMGLLAIAFFVSAGLLWRKRWQSVEGAAVLAVSTDLEIVPEHFIARRGTLEVSLTQRDLKLLRLLQRSDGAVVTKDQLYDEGWGRDYMPNSRALDQHMINLRRKLDPDHSLPVLIETVRGVGYRLVL